MSITLKTSCTRWSALLLLTIPGLSLYGATGPSETNSAAKGPAWQVVGPATTVQQPPVMTSIRAELVMVNAWDEKFAVTHDGKVREFKMAHGGLLFRRGKPATLDTFAVGQDVMLVVYEHPSGKWDLLSASALPREKRVEAAGKVEKSVQPNSDPDPEVAKKSEKEARRLAKAEAKAKEEADEQAREQAEAEAKAQKRAEKEARKQAEADAERQKEEQEKADKQARKLAEAQAKGQKQAEKEARKQAEANAQAQKEAQKKADKEARERAKVEAKARKQAEKQALKQAEADAKARKKAEKDAGQAPATERRAEELIEQLQPVVPAPAPVEQPETAPAVPSETPEN
jgi:hypothetical protein